MTYAQEILKKFDILCIQEHWIFNTEQHMLGDLNINMRFTAKSVDDDNPELSMVARRGYGGIAILWKKEIDDKIQILNEGNNRVQVIQIDTECRPICLINIYLPSDSKEHNYEYNDMLSQLAEILNKFRETHHIFYVKI
jgi:exonuclease III